MIIFRDVEGVEYPYSASSSKHRVRLSAYTIIENEEQEICIIRTQKTQNKWEFPGGECEFLEELDECARREVKEELGFQILLSNSPLMHSINHCYFRSTNEFVKKVDFFYTATLINLKAFQPKQVGNEVVKEVKWIKREELENYEFIWIFKEIVEYMTLHSNK